MAWPFLNGVIQVKVTWGFQGKPSVNVHFVLMDSPVSPVPDAALLTAANDLYGAISDNWRDLAAATWSLENITALDWSMAEGNEIPTDQTLPRVGLTVTNAVPTSNATVVSQRTEQTGRSRRGRNYIPGLNISTVTGNLLNADWLVDLSLLYSDFRTALGTHGQKHVVYSLYSEGVARVTPIATPITSTIVNSRVDTQRRRLPD